MTTLRTHTAPYLSAALLIFLMTTSIFVLQAYSQESTKAASQLRAAIEHYTKARYDAAIAALSALTDESTLGRDDRKEAYLFLARSYLAKDLHEECRTTIERLLQLEPPMIMPDPDAECPPFMKIYYDVRKKQTGSAAIERPDPGIQTIAILDFKNRSVDHKEKFDPMEKGFAELMIGKLSGSVNLKVVERERIQWILDEIGLENDPGKFDMGSAVRVGKQLGVHTILLGSFIKVRNTMKLLARLVKVETSEILATEEVTGDADEFFELTEELGVKVAKKINVVVSKAELGKASETKSLDAMLAYSEGLVALEKGDYKGAYEKFLHALNLDPRYEKAKVKAQSLKPLLG